MKYNKFEKDPDNNTMVLKKKVKSPASHKVGSAVRMLFA